MDPKAIAKKHKKAKLKALKDAKLAAEEPEEIEKPQKQEAEEEEKVGSVGEVEGDDKYFSGTKFSEMNLCEPTLKSLEQMKFSTCTPI